MASKLPKKEINDAVLRMLSTGLIFHLAHIASTSLPRHEALKSAYETIEESADLLGEVTMGMDGTAILSDYASLDPVAEMNILIEHLLKLAGAITDDPLKALVEDQISKLRHQVTFLQQT